MAGPVANLTAREMPLATSDKISGTAAFGWRINRTPQRASRENNSYNEKVSRAEASNEGNENYDMLRMIRNFAITAVYMNMARNSSREYPVHARHQMI
jgi:hypothetical protein